MNPLTAPTKISGLCDQIPSRISGLMVYGYERDIDGVYLR